MTTHRRIGVCTGRHTLLSLTFLASVEVAVKRRFAFWLWLAERLIAEKLSPGASDGSCDDHAEESAARDLPRASRGPAQVIEAVSHGTAFATGISWSRSRSWFTRARAQHALIRT